MSRIGWLDLSSGVAGDMLLGAVVSAGVPLSHLSDALEPLRLPLSVRAVDVRRAGIAAVHVVVETSGAEQPRRTLCDIVQLLAPLPASLRAAATGVFSALADAEAAVHGVPVDDVHFHEVGALDAIADIVGVCAGVAALRLDELIASPIALGGGHARTDHGRIPLPGPAVLALLQAANAPGYGTSEEGELATPTGVALVTALADGFGPLPALRPSMTGVGAGSRNPTSHPNVVRLVVGDAVASDGRRRMPRSTPGEPAVVLEANVDDLDPRTWPLVLTALLEAGAVDAWLTPVLTKKGRPAHVVSATAVGEATSAVRDVLFRETTTLGVRETAVVRDGLRRTFRTVDVDGQTVKVKLGLDRDGGVVNAMPEWEDVVAAADLLGRPVKGVLAQALGLAARLVADHSGGERAVQGRLAESGERPASDVPAPARSTRLT